MFYIIPAWIGKTHRVSHSCLTTGSIKTIKNTNNFSIFNWIPWSSHGITEVKLIHAGNAMRE
ncbi:hypothetical protein [Rickettsia asembonensis]|uniref:hypothetical protein n=1 Tax=Rickettsia asembonensis TaxID=1068590 RepID=UPI0009D658DD|nr:hypothetical protein [Rickettsia asembonensis]